LTKLSPNRERHRLVRSWIMQTPRPHSLRCTTQGDRQSVVCGASTWSDTTSTVLALNPDTIEALDATGNVLRASPFIDIVEPELEPEHAATLAPPPAAPTEPRMNLAELVGDDGESRRFALFAQLLSDAYRHANDVAFAKIAEISQQQMERASSAERTLDQFIRAEQLRLEVLRAELDARQAAADDDDDDDDAGGGAFNEAVGKIAKHVAKSVGADDEDDDDEDDDDEAPEQQQHAAPNGAGGH
jgi:hypothetical protein